MAMKNWLPVLLSFVVIGLIGCGIPATEQPIIAAPTRDPLEIYVGAHSNQATAQAAQATAEYFQQMITATVAAQQATATERAWLVQQTQVAAQTTATAQVWAATATADSIRSTSTASVSQTAQAVSIEATRIALDATASANQADARAYATAMAAQAESVQLALERDRKTNTFRAVLPWAGLVAAFVLLLYLTYYRGRILIIPKDERGDAKLIGDIVDGTVTDPDRMFHPQGGLRRGDLHLLKPPSAEQQAEITARDQLVDLASRPSGGGERQRLAAGMSVRSAALPAPAPKVEVVSPEKVQPVVQDVMPPLLMDAVEGEVSDE